MPTRDLETNRAQIQKKFERLENFAARELAKAYDRAMDDVRSTLSRLYEQYMTEGELTQAEAARFLRISNIEQELTDVVRPHMLRNEEFLKEISQVSFERSFYEHAWAVDQAAGVQQAWGQLSPDAVRAATGISDDTAALGEVISEREAREHKRVLDEAFDNYADDTRRWIGREVTQGVIQGESVDKVARRVRDNAFVQSQNSAQTIARTETLRAMGLGGQMAYDRAAEKGVQVRQVWDATLDSRTRPLHAQLDGKVRDEQTGAFSVLGIGDVAGPRRSGVPSFDINCRCTIRPEIEGYSPRVRRTREGGIQPYQTFDQWARRQGITANRFGEKYSFLD